MNRKLSRWFWTAVAFLWALPVGAAPFQVKLETDAVLISGMTPKGEAVLLGVTREIGEDDFHTVRRHLKVLADEDGDGAIRYPVEEGVQLRSLWAVADLTNGAADIAAPEKFGVRRVNWRGRGLERPFEATVAAVSKVLGTKPVLQTGRYQAALFEALRAQRNSLARRALVRTIYSYVYSVQKCNCYTK